MRTDIYQSPLYVGDILMYCVKNKGGDSELMLQHRLMSSMK